MGIQREDGGYSAHVEGFLVIAGQPIRLAKTNDVILVLAEDCNIAPGTEADLDIYIDGDRETQRVLIEDGTVEGQRSVRYRVLAPF